MKKTKVVFIYGPPASGKLTVAKELAKITGFKVLHNHMTFDLVKSIIDFNLKDNKKFFDVNNKIKKVLMKTILEEKINVINTFCYGYKKKDSITKYKEIIEELGGKAYFVKLDCSKKELRKRVKGKSRKKWGKVQTIKDLNKSLKHWDFFRTIKGVENFEIKGDNISAKKAAKMIKEHYKL